MTLFGKIRHDPVILLQQDIISIIFDNRAVDLGMQTSNEGDVYWASERLLCLIEVVELMRSEINTERRETAVDRKNVVEIMKSTAEISEYHAAKKMKWLISGISFVMAVLGVMVTQSTKVFSSIAFYGCIIGCTTCVVLLRQYWEIREKREFYFSLIWCLGAASLIWMFQLFSIKAINSIMDVGSILIGSVIDFIFLKDFIESVIKKKYLQMAVCGIFLLSTTVDYFRIVLK